MIHPLTLVTFAAFLGAGLYVFQTKEEVAKLDRDLRDVTRQIEGERARTQTLSAEWARLNDQDRLRSMVTSHLRDMQPMEPAQFQRMDDAQRRMPQAVAFVPEPTGFRRRADAPSAPGEVLVFTAASMFAEAEPRRAAPPQRSAPAPEPAVVASAAPALPPAPPAASAPVAAAPRPAPVTVAAVAPAPRPAVTPRPEVAALPPIAGPSAVAAPIARPAAPAAAHPPVELAAVAPRAALPPIAGPARTAEPSAARLAEAAAAPRPAPRARAEAPPPRPSQLAQAPVAPPPSPLRTAMHVQPAPVPGGSLLGGGTSLPPPVPFGR